MILYVHDMASEVHFYRDVLGLCLGYPPDVSDFDGEMWVEFEIGDTILALHGGAGARPDALHEVVFWVADIAQARQAVVSAGYQIGEIRTLEDGALIAEGLDPAGHRYALRTAQ